MKAGALRHRVTIQRLTAGSPQQKPSGEADMDWATLYQNVPAAIEPLRGRELYAAQEHHSEATVRIRIRWVDDVTAGDRFVFDDLYYGIVWVPPVDKKGKQFDMELLTRQGVNDG